MTNDNLLTPDEAAERLGVGKRYVLKARRENRLKGQKVGKFWRFLTSEVDRLAGIEQPPTTAIATTEQPRDDNQGLKDEIEKLELEATKRKLEEAARLDKAGLTEREFLAMLEAHAMLKEAYEAQEGKIEELTIKGNAKQTDIDERDEDIEVLRHQLEVCEAANKMQIREVSPTELRFTWRGKDYIIRSDELRYRAAGTSGAWYYKNAVGAEWPLT